MKKTDRILSDEMLAKFIVGLDRESISVVSPPMIEPYSGHGMSVMTREPAAIFAGGVRLSHGAYDIKALIAEREALIEELERVQDKRRAKVSVHGGKATVSSDGVITIKGGSVTIKGPSQLVEVTA